MNRIGLDFGTTNSILSYVDPQSRAVVSHRFGGAGGRDYEPSFIAYDKHDQTVTVGGGARVFLGDPDHEVYSRFKLLLAEQDQEILRRRGYNGRSPKDVSLVFIRELITKYQRETNTQVENMVITVPEIWKREGNHLAQETLKNLCKEAGFKKLHMLSEPVAALVYFTRRFQEEQQRDFKGHVLVCDFGGGTLDLSLAAVEGNHVDVLEGTGWGDPGSTLGAAGVAFDEAVVKRVLEEAQEQNVIDDPFEFHCRVKEFEDNKIETKESLDKWLRHYRTNSAMDRRVFSVRNHPFYARHLVEEFDRLIAPKLNSALNAMQQYFDVHGVDQLNAERFRVLLVGGFSNFSLVREVVREFFESRTDDDRRFETCFSLADTALAISKGAAMQANEMASVEYTCPISVGVVGKQPERGWNDCDFPVLHKGRKASEYREPRFIEQWCVLGHDPARQELTLFLDVGNGIRRNISLRQSLDHIFPNPNYHENRWRIGFSLDEDMLFYLHVRDRDDHEKITPLGDLEKEHLSGLLFYDRDL